jgi:hypothetical protein
MRRVKVIVSDPYRLDNAGNEIIVENHEQMFDESAYGGIEHPAMVVAAALRKRLERFAKCFGGTSEIRFSDADAEVESSGNFLRIEFKLVGQKLSGGQARLLRALSRLTPIQGSALSPFEVFVVWTDQLGEIREITEITADESRHFTADEKWLSRRIQDWFLRSNDDADRRGGWPVGITNKHVRRLDE